MAWVSERTKQIQLNDLPHKGPAVMVFDIETVPDCVSGRRLLSLKEDTPDDEVAEALRQRRLTQTQQSSDFMPHYLQQIVAISVLVSTPQFIKVWSLGDLDSPEADLIERFFLGIERYTPTLVSWNGSGFDLPVLHYRALFKGITAARYWEQGAYDPAFKYNNYLNRYHSRHLDLMDVLSGYQGRAVAPLDEISKLVGFPGKLGEEGSHVWDKYLKGQHQAIRDYCETDVVNTYGVYLAFQKMQGTLDAEGLHAEKHRLKTHLMSLNKPHWAAFLEAI